MSNINKRVFIQNAGLVILNGYFLMLFERLGLVKNGTFVSKESQLEAVHYLQYAVTGLTQAGDTSLVLNKVLCGIPPNIPIHNNIEISEVDKQLIKGLLKSSIDYWKAIGSTSMNGFRGNWLVREGILKETEDSWELTVEERSYDVLMIKSPFSFSIIKLPWMIKPLYVTWPF